MNQLYNSSNFRLSILSLLLLISFHGFGQTVLNGDFENNTSPGNSINNTNAQYTIYMANSVSFGSYGDMDIITTAMYCGLAEHGSWYVAFTGGGTDAISLTLSAPLVQGNTYSISYWDRGCTGWIPEPFQFGLSTADSVFGTTIYTSPFTPTDGTWSQRTFTFTAPNNGQYLTIQTLGALANWTQLDNVQFTNSGPPVISDFLASDSVLCQDDCISFTDLSTNNPTSWSWKFTGAAVDTSTMQNPTGICYLNAGTFPVSLYASNANGGDTLTITNYIKVNPSPATPSITQHNDTLICTSDTSYQSYQWYADTALIAGATDTLLVVSKNGNYNIKVTNHFNCSIAVGINVTLTGLQIELSQGMISLYPNPVGNQLTVYGLRFTHGVSLYIYNVLGEMIFNLKQETRNKEQETILDVSSLSKGVYFLEIKTEQGMVMRRFVKE